MPVLNYYFCDLNDFNNKINTSWSYNHPNLEHSI